MTTKIGHIIETAQNNSWTEVELLRLRIAQLEQENRALTQRLAVEITQNNASRARLHAVAAALAAE